MSERKCLECTKRKKLEYSGFWCCGGNQCEVEVRADERVKAIEEYKIALHTQYKENRAFAYSVWEGNIYKFDAMANLDLEEIDEIAEQLKEHKNG